MWRWHFYASFLVIPVLLLLAVTGLIYLFRFQLEPLVNRDLMHVAQPPDTLAQPYSTQLVVAERAVPDGTALSMTEPSTPDRSTVFSFEMADGSSRDVYVDPYTLESLGSLDPETTLSGYAVRLHGELMAGTLGDAVIELAACWAIVMALSGYYLFVRGWTGTTAQPGPRSARRRPPPPARPGGSVRRGGAALPARVGTAVDRLLGRAGPGARHQPGHLAVEHRPRRHLRPDLLARRVPAAQPPGRAAVGAGGAGGADLGPVIVRGRQRRHPRHGRRWWPTGGVAAPDDGRDPDRGRRRLLGDRLRVRRPDRRADRARGPVRRRGGVDVRLRRLPGAGQGRVAGHRAPRGPSARGRDRWRCRR